MSIKRLSFPEGQHFDRTRELQDTLQEIVIANIDRLTHLTEGELDLTPQAFDSTRYTHNLIVHPDDKATYRMLPREKDVGIREVTDNGLGPTRPGGRIVRIPEDQSIIVIAGPTRDNPQLRIFEIIIHIPDTP